MTFEREEREETHQPVSLGGKQNYKMIESWGGGDGTDWPSFMLNAVYWVIRVVHNKFGLIMGSSNLEPCCEASSMNVGPGTQLVHCPVCHLISVTM